MRRRKKIEDIILWHRDLFPSDGSFRIDCGDWWFDIIFDFCMLTLWALRNGFRHVKTPGGEMVAHPAPTFQFTAIYQQIGWLYLKYEILQPEADTTNRDISDIEKRLLEVTCEVKGLQKYARHLSTKTCEECGLPGHPHVVNMVVPGGRFLNPPPQGWNKTLCADCAKLLGYYEPEWRPPM